MVRWEKKNVRAKAVNQGDGMRRLEATQSVLRRLRGIAWIRDRRPRLRANGSREWTGDGKRELEALAANARCGVCSWSSPKFDWLRWECRDGKLTFSSSAGKGEGGW